MRTFERQGTEDWLELRRGQEEDWLLYVAEHPEDAAHHVDELGASDVVVIDGEAIPVVEYDDVPF